MKVPQSFASVIEPLSPGSTIGLVMPASMPNTNRIQEAVTGIGSRGYRTKRIGMEAQHISRTVKGDRARAGALM